LRHLGGGRFEGIWEPRTPSAGAPAELTVHFRNDWMDVEARRSVVIDDYLDLALAASPNPLELGVWRGERGPSRRCADLDLSGSTNADRIPIKCVIEGLPRGFEGSCLPLPDVGGDSAEPLAWRVCVRTPRCCGEADGSATFARLSGQDARYAATSLAVPVRFRVEETGFLRCWWPVLALAAALLVVLFVLWGFLSPHGFDPAFTVRVAGSEAGLRRTSALVLREMPGGSRGFYRNAHTCLNADGDFLRSPRRAVLVLEAGPGGSTRFVRAAGMERRNRRNNLWEPLPVEDLHMGFAAGVIYRIGGLFLKFE
jgi:hypothetical protein